MLIPYNEIVNKYNIRPEGVIHIGASTGQEVGYYYINGIKRSIWIEAIPAVFDELVKNIANRSNAIAFNECISDEDGKEVEFHITNNEGQSSSFLELAKHKEHHPEIHVVETIKCVTKTMRTLLKEEDIDIADYELLNIDLQGAELLALKGMKELLSKVKYIYIEVNKEELYKDCALVEQVDEFLAEYGFERKETRWTNFNWGDAYYQNIKLIKEAKGAHNAIANNPSDANFNALANIEQP